MDPAAPSPPDRELLASAAVGDRSAFDRFVLRHSPAVHRYARALAQHDADAEDVLQQTFVQAWRGCGGARFDGDARPWLLTIARHALFRLRRRLADQPSSPVSLEELGGDAGFAAADATPERFAMAAEERCVLDDALHALPPADREVLVLREIERLSGEETAQVLGLTVEAMKSRLHRARLRLVAEVRRRLPQGDQA